MQCAAKGGDLNGGKCMVPVPPKPHHWWETALAIVAVVAVVAIAIACVVQPELIPAVAAIAESGATAFLGTGSVTAAVVAASATAVEVGATAVGATTIAAFAGGVAIAAGGGSAIASGPSGSGSDYMAEADSHTPGGHAITHGETATAIGSDTATMNNFNNVAPIDGVHDVVAHGTRSGYLDLGNDGSDLTNGGQLVEAVRGNPNYTEGQPCRLIVCHSGVSGIGQQVANELNVPVLAPSDRVGTRGSLGPGQQPRIANNGTWSWIFPEGG